MKFIFCCDCQEIVRLRRELRKCVCGKSSGRYVDETNAEIQGNCIPIGIKSSSFEAALRAQPKGPGKGKRFEAFVIPKICNTVRVLK